MGVKIKDIADIANVSIATVSLVLNNKPGIKESTRKKILETAKKLNYALPKVSNNNHTKKGVIRFLKIAKHGHTVNRDHEVFIADYIDGLDKEARNNGYCLELSTFKTDDIRQIVELVKDSTPDGIIVLGTELNYEDIKHFESINAITVFIDTYYDYFKYDFIDMNNKDAVFHIISNFIENGHREIGLIRTPVEVENFKLREIGFKQALKHFEISYNDKYIFSVDSTFEGAYSDTLQILSKSVKLPTALFSINDITAYGVIKALKEKGYSVPEDISIIGFDDLPLSAVMDPPLTTLKVSKTRIGKIAMKHAIIRLEGNPQMPPEKVLVGGKLINRGSVKKINI